MYVASQKNHLASPIPLISELHHETFNIHPVFFISSKGRIGKLATADIIYNIPCSNSTATYIRTTKWILETRLLEHDRNFYYPPDKSTTLTKHAWQQDHTFSYDSVQIVDKSVNYKKGMILKITHIDSNLK